LDYFKERPLTGSGATTFPAMMMLHGEISGEPVHNVPLLVLAETGIGGGVAIVAFGLALVWAAWRRRGTHLMFALATAALFALLTIAMFDHFLWSLSEGRLWFALVLGWWLGTLNSEI
jgi:O-antigen ligase